MVQLQHVKTMVLDVFIYDQTRSAIGAKADTFCVYFLEKYVLKNKVCGVNMNNIEK